MRRVWPLTQGWFQAGWMVEDGYAGCLTTERSDILQFEKRCEARQNEIRDGSVLAHVTKRIAAITPPRALVVLRFLLNNPQRTVCF